MHLSSKYIYLSFLEVLPKNGLRPFFYEIISSRSILTTKSVKIMLMQNISAKKRERVKVLLNLLS